MTAEREIVKVYPNVEIVQSLTAQSGGTRFSMIIYLDAPVS